MSDWIADGELVLSMRTKLNTLRGQFAITVTDQVITAGAVTSIPVTDIGTGILFSGDVLILEDNTTYLTHTLTLTSDYTAGDNALAVSSITFATDIPVNSSIYLSFKTVVQILRNVP